MAAHSSEIDIPEVTITHSHLDASAQSELVRGRLVAIEFGISKKAGTLDEAIRGFSDLNRRFVSQVRLFASLPKTGAAVVAAYPGAKDLPPNMRLIGRIEAGTPFQWHGAYAALTLSQVQKCDASRSFLGNLPARQQTIQRCDNRAKGRLRALVLGNIIERDVASLHHRDVEILVAEYLRTVRGCRAVWSGGKSFADVDHVALERDGSELSAQTTVSSDADTIEAKCQVLGAHTTTGSRVIFAHRAAEAVLDRQKHPKVDFVSLEDVFKEVDASESGKWLIDRMFEAASSNGESTR